MANYKLSEEATKNFGSASSADVKSNYGEEVFLCNEAIETMKGALSVLHNEDNVATIASTVSKVAGLVERLISNVPDMSSQEQEDFELAKSIFEQVKIVHEEAKPTHLPSAPRPNFSEIERQKVTAGKKAELEAKERETEIMRREQPVETSMHATEFDTDKKQLQNEMEKLEMKSQLMEMQVLLDRERYEKKILELERDRDRLLKESLAKQVGDLEAKAKPVNTLWEELTDWFGW